MAKDAKLVFSFEALTAAAGILGTTVSNGVATVTLTTVPNLGWRRAYSAALNVGGFTLYAPGADTKGTAGKTVTGPMGSDLYLNGTVACAANFTENPNVWVMVEAASDNSGSAGTDWAPVSGVYRLPPAATTLTLPAKRFNVKVAETSKPWFRVTLLCLAGATAPSTGQVTLSNCSLVLGRDGTVVNG